MPGPGNDNQPHRNVFGFPPSTTFTPDQALASAGQLALKQVLVIGYDEDGELTVRSSRMTRGEALWLVEHARHHVLHGE